MVLWHYPLPSTCLTEYLSVNVDYCTEVIVQGWKDTDYARGTGVPVLSENYMFLSDQAAPTSSEKQRRIRYHDSPAFPEEDKHGRLMTMPSSARTNAIIGGGPVYET